MSAVAISADGRLVSFDCTDAYLVPNDNNDSLDVFVHDLVAGATELI